MLCSHNKVLKSWSPCLYFSNAGIAGACYHARPTLPILWADKNAQHRFLDAGKVGCSGLTGACYISLQQENFPDTSKRSTNFCTRPMVYILSFESQLFLLELFSSTIVGKTQPWTIDHKPVSRVSRLWMWVWISTKAGEVCILRTLTPHHFSMWLSGESHGWSLVCGLPDDELVSFYITAMHLCIAGSSINFKKK